MMNEKFLADKIADLRKSKGMTQEELAEKTNLSTRTIQRIEAGDVDPRLYTLKVIAEALEVSVDEFNAPPEADEKGPLALVHLAALAGFFIPLGNIGGPLVVWMHNKNKIKKIDMHAKRALNAQISYSAYFLVILVAFLFFIIFGNVMALEQAHSYQDIVDQGHMGTLITILTFALILEIPILLSIIFSVINSIRMYNGKNARHYPLSIPFLR